ncbi:MAG: AAA family ATPase, partial [Thermodesulfobacteriota bacterium]
VKMVETALNIPSIGEKIELLNSNIKKIIKGKDDVIFNCLCAFFSKGHILIEDIPGVGKTTLAYALSKSMGLEYKKIQFTSDLMPSDILGISIYDQQSKNFVFKPGPVFTNILLADEINRATPKAQSALLEAMNDSAVTIDGKFYRLSNPFLVIATQNPYENQGTFQLPESQVDRFSIRIKMGYPDSSSEKDILTIDSHEKKWEGFHSVLSSSEIIDIQDYIETIKIDDSILDYIVEISRRTRQSSYFELGVSTRGTISLKRLAQARAFLNGRSYCTPDDVKKMVVPAFSHRVILKAEFEGNNSEKNIFDELLTTVSVPV